MNDTALWEIVEAVVAMEPFVYNDNSGDMECVFCEATHSDFLNQQSSRYHCPDCVCLKALALIGQKRKENKP